MHLETPRQMVQLRLLYVHSINLAFILSRLMDCFVKKSSQIKIITVDVRTSSALVCQLYLTGYLFHASAILERT